MRLKILLGKEEKIAEVKDIKRSSKIPPRMDIEIDDVDFVLELDMHDDERILKDDTVYGNVYLEAHLISRKHTKTVYIKKIG